MATEKARLVITRYAEAWSKWAKGPSFDAPNMDSAIATIVAAEEAGRPVRAWLCFRTHDGKCLSIHSTQRSLNICTNRYTSQTHTPLIERDAKEPT